FALGSVGVVATRPEADMHMGVVVRSGRRVALAAALALLIAVAGGAASPPATAEDAAEGTVSAKGTLGQGYALVASDGGIFNYGDSDFFGSTGSIPLNKPIVGMEYTPTGEGYWLVASDGGIFAFGDAPFLGSTGSMTLNQPIVGMAATPSGNGYWLVAADGGIFTFGDAQFFGSTGSLQLVRPIVGMDVHPSGLGYWLVAADGGIFTFGDPSVIAFWGSRGGAPLNKPIVDMAATPSGNGYYLVATDGGIFTFGDAVFRGSMGGSPLNQPVNGMTLTPFGLGYWLVAADGGIFTFGDAPFLGSRGGQPLNKPVVGMSATPYSPVTAPDFFVTLEGEQEVPGPGDGDGFGFALLDFTADELCWHIQANNVSTPTAAHIHEAPAGVAGGVVFAFPTPAANGLSVGCRPIDPALVGEIFADPERFYVNVHTSEYPSGAVRGQLVEELVVAATADNQLVMFLPSSPEQPVLGPIPVTGLGDGEVLAGIDFRPATGDLYLLTQEGTTGRIYSMAALDAPASRVGSTDIDLGAAVGVGFDFNPVVDRIRITTGTSDLSIVVNPNSGTEQSRGALTPGTVDVAGVAYSNNVVGVPAPAATTLYGIDSLGAQLVTVNPATGAVTGVGPLGFAGPAVNGFDIAPAPAGELGTALLVAFDGTGTPALRALDLATGTSINLGEVADGTLAIVAAAIL
ncbi:MAG TPA: DUF4394 domain-containing protein, partial [Acidimicrobiales bacterium]|nr:DUF4394 domain-containing protein [Acidimicrobiales bacterium]